LATRLAAASAVPPPWQLTFTPALVKAVARPVTMVDFSSATFAPLHFWLMAVANDSAMAVAKVEADERAEPLAQQLAAHAWEENRRIGWVTGGLVVG
jgi:hypothetical protein